MPPDPRPAAWWRRAVVYQVYIRSFADADGDGDGDIAGIRSRLPYLRGLGVDAIWITPWYRSPMVDGGYDVADPRSIDPTFGTLADAEGLVAAAHEAGIRVILDVVPNHTSSDHPWFREALAGPPGSRARSRYLFRDGRGPGGELPPNDWTSVFGGPAWSRVPDPDGRPGQWYLHLFDAAQPDLDWTDPEVRADAEATLGFWLDRGIDGFRIDVAHFLAKAPGLPDLGPVAPVPGRDDHPFIDRDEVHEIHRSWRRLVEARRPDAVLCGEVSLPAARIARYLRPDELHTAFNFDFALRPWSAGALRDSIDATLATHGPVGAPPTWVLGNHDLPRPSFRLGRTVVEPFDAWTRRADADQQLGGRRARAAALLALALPGSAYLHQGEELGLPEVLDLPAAARLDPTFRRTGGREPGRDGCRIPLPWTRGPRPFGFGPPGSIPWLPQPDGWGERSVEAQEGDPGSPLELHRRALALRRSHPGLAGEGFAWLDAPPSVLRFARDDAFECVVNLGGAPVALPAGRRLLLASGPLGEGLLPPETAAWLERAEPADAG